MAGAGLLASFTVVANSGTKIMTSVSVFEVKYPVPLSQLGKCLLFYDCYSA